jgi:hypothetical protein
VAAIAGARLIPMQDHLTQRATDATPVSVSTVTEPTTNGIPASEITLLLVATPEQAEVVRWALAEGENQRATLGLPSGGASVVVVDETAADDRVLEAIAAETMRTYTGRTGFVVTDLRRP